VRWFVEMKTASKAGRPLFNEMVALLKKGEAEGVVIHKVDRSTRNYNDWADIGALLKEGIGVHFATEAFDLTTLGGMLAADMQAVMAVHYSRNLSDEVKKGYYGRLKQGLYPRPAPIGYINSGKGKPKVIDLVTGPMVKQAFELYATGRYSQHQVMEEMYKLGLRTRKGKKVSQNLIAMILSNPFYMGVMHVNKGNHTFAGVHEPLISRVLFERVQDIMHGRHVRPTKTHQFEFSRLISCATCGRSLIGEIQKGHIYYRCHSRNHPAAILKEEEIEKKFSEVFESLRLLPEEDTLIDKLLAEMTSAWTSEIRQRMKAGEFRIVSLGDKLDRLTDAYLEGLVGKSEMEQKKTALLLERREAEKQVTEIQNGDADGLVLLNKIVERIKHTYSLYKTASPEEKRDAVLEVMSNRIASAKNLDISLSFPFSEIAKRDVVRSGEPLTGRSRTWKNILDRVSEDLRNPAKRQEVMKKAA